MEPKVFTRIAQSRDAAIAHCLGVIDDKLAEFSATQLPAGAIFPFSGLFGGPENKYPVDPHTRLPNTGFALCDGGTYSAPGKPAVITPDLRDRFVLCSGTTHPIGERGGTSSATLPVTIGETTLTASQMPNHSHSIFIAGGSGRCVADAVGGSGSNVSLSTLATGGGLSHGHTATVAGGIPLPPYYSLAYIMKL